MDLSLGLQTVPIGVECDSLAIHGICSFEVPWDAGERVFCRGERHANADYHIRCSRSCSSLNLYYTIMSDRCWMLKRGNTASTLISALAVRCGGARNLHLGSRTNSGASLANY